MNGKLQLATCLMWLAVPITASDYWLVWDRLPARMAVHFDINWQANGWASREAAFGFAVGVVSFMLLIFTIASYAVGKSPVPGFSRRSLLAFFYAVLVLVCAVNHWVVRYNLGEHTISSVQTAAMARFHQINDDGIKDREPRTENCFTTEALCSTCRG
jgi:Domain of unknown function (DUF1648)